MTATLEANETNPNAATPAPIYSALIADDDGIVRAMVAHALSMEGFVCDKVTDGDGAIEALKSKSYDLLVTDLRMPNKNGHSLIVDVIEQKKNLILIVHTSVEDVALTKDLFVRGVDDVVYKPTNYATFAVKAFGMVERNKQRSTSSVENDLKDFVVDEKVSFAVASSANSGNELKILIRDHMTQFEKLFPVAKAAYKAYLLTSRHSNDEELVEAIARIPSLSAEVLKCANSAFFSPRSPITDVRVAIARIGRVKIRQLARASCCNLLFNTENIF